MDWQSVTFVDGSVAFDGVVLRHKSRAARSLCVVPAKSVEFLRDPEFHAEFVRPVVDRGATVVCFPNYFTDLLSLAERVRTDDGEDPFRASTRRIKAVITHCLQQRLGKSGSVTLIGVSRYGFASLHALASVSEVNAVAAISPVTWWPHLSEFRGTEDAPLIRNNDLSDLIPSFPPRAVLIQIGLSDERVSTQRCREFARLVDQTYRGRGMEDKFCFQTFDVPGHVSNGKFYGAIVDWMRRQGLLTAASEGGANCGCAHCAGAGQCNA